MSRVGKKPVPLRKGVKISIGEQLQVEGPKGKLTVPIPQGVRLKQADGTLTLEREGDQFAALHGLTRALAANAIQGVSTEIRAGARIVVRLSRRCQGQDRHFGCCDSHPSSARMVWT